MRRAAERSGNCWRLPSTPPIPPLEGPDAVHGCVSMWCPSPVDHARRRWPPTGPGGWGQAYPPPHVLVECTCRCRGTAGQSAAAGETATDWQQLPPGRTRRNRQMNLCVSTTATQPRQCAAGVMKAWLGLDRSIDRSIDRLIKSSGRSSATVVILMSSSRARRQFAPTMCRVPV